MSSLSRARQKRYKDSHLHGQGEKQCRSCTRLPFTHNQEKEETGVCELGKRGRMIWGNISRNICPMMPHVLDGPKPVRTEPGHWAYKSEETSILEMESTE